MPEEVSHGLVLTRTSTLFTPLLGVPVSVAVPLTVMEEVEKDWPLVGAVMLTAGGVVSGRLEYQTSFLGLFGSVPPPSTQTLSSNTRLVCPPLAVQPGVLVDSDHVWPSGDNHTSLFGETLSVPPPISQ